MDRAAIRTRRLVAALGLNVALAGAQLVGGLVAHSMGLLSDAGHNVTDVAGVGVSLLAVRWATRPRSPSRSFGYHRGPILAALANTAVIAVVTVAIVVESVVRLLHPGPVHGGIVVTVAAVEAVRVSISKGRRRSKGASCRQAGRGGVPICWGHCRVWGL